MNRRFLPIFVVVLVNFIGSTIVIPVLPLFVQQHFGASPPLVSLLYASFFIAQFIASPYLGRLSDQYGRRPVLLVSQLGTAASFVLMAVAGTLPLMFIARILDGVTGGNVIVAQAYLTDITTKEERTRALGLTWAAFGIGLAFGGVIGGVLTHFFGERAPFIAGAVLSFAAVLMTWALLPETTTAEQRTARRQSGRSTLSRSEVTSNLPLLLILLIGFMGQLSMMLFQSTWALYAEEVLFDAESASLWAGLLLALHGVAQFITQFALIQKLLERFGERRLLMFGAAVRALSLLSFVLLPYPVSVALLGMIGFAVGSGVMMPPLQSLATQSARPEVSGALLGIYQSAISMGVITGAVISGFLFAASPFLPYLLGGLLTLAALLPASRLLRQPALAV